jgi:creatinine amidohydrolase
MMNPMCDWADMTWQDIAAGDTARWIAVLPIAAIEQHGPHLPLCVDSAIADIYLERVRALLPQTVPATFLPVQRIGLSNEHVEFPGTLTFSLGTVVAAWTEIGESLARAGVRKLLIVTSHGGNVAAMDIVARDLRVRKGMFVVTTSWHRMGYPEGLFDEGEQHHGIHGGDIETSVMLAGRSAVVRADKMSNAVPATVAMEQEFKYLSAARPAGFGWMAQDINACGAIGDATRATAAKGQAAIDHGARAFVELLGEIDRFDLARLSKGPLG